MRETPFSANGAFWMGLSLLLFSFVYASWTLPNYPPKGVKTDGELSIEAIKPVPSRFGERLHVRGTLNRLPVAFYFPKKEQRLLKNYSTLHVQGSISQTSFGSYWLELDKKVPIKGVEQGPSWAYRRHVVKENLKKKIASCYKNENCSSLISALLLGTSPPSHLNHAFGRFGLQHLLAISGFHFGLLSLFASFLLKRLFPYRLVPHLLALLMALYALLLDPSPSVLRALVTFLAMQSTQLLCRESTSLNRLGVALIAVLLFDPTYCLKIGFQFSFAVTASILLFFEPIDRYFQRLQTPIEPNRLSLLDKHALLILIFFRKLLSLTLAVQLTALPLALYWFQSFPLLSLLYNLFFPLLIGLSLALFLIALALPPLHSLNELLIEGLLQTFNVPSHRDVLLVVPPFHWLLVALWFALLLSYILFKKQDNPPALLEFY